MKKCADCKINIKVRAIRYSARSYDRRVEQQKSYNRKK